MKAQDYLKISAFIVAMAVIIVFSDQIQDYIVTNYNQYVETLASKTIASNNLNGF
ncbi:hypothetical protein [Psychroserpens sp.]|uniref:hypothetical protein n=1 Tax=Psychroserpens sp. TaxID=2020870 RepID=UPI001B04AB8D|nr:hypothetical protein [Psychroserpens sp.]MBO6607996.1 hypothetical protein [Psychroserpens sp.]MBO6631874.1 hypothetical protein [Psychroserpens sp.]MBO6654877.1 hypothetical protein [Psychroserpens sp.]MBO6683049.1 hypothetical protein [Psychroserpens sp.]MBO6751354.1 hypothetical protein [Psychroserpens sp.]